MSSSAHIALIWASFYFWTLWTKLSFHFYKLDTKRKPCSSAALVPFMGNSEPGVGV
jgi:hypothetical protein